MKSLFLLIWLGTVVTFAEAQQTVGINQMAGQPHTFITPTIDASNGVIRPGWFGASRDDITITQWGIFTPVPLAPAPPLPSALASTPSASALASPSASAPASIPPTSALRTTPYGIVMPGYPSILDRPLAPYGITLPSPADTRSRP